MTPEEIIFKYSAAPKDSPTYNGILAAMTEYHKQELNIIVDRLIEISNKTGEDSWLLYKLKTLEILYTIKNNK